MPRLTQPTQPLFNNIICTKKQVVKDIMDTRNVSERTAYRMIAGQRKWINEYEKQEVVQSATNNLQQRLQQLQLEL